MDNCSALWILARSENEIVFLPKERKGRILFM